MNAATKWAINLFNNKLVTTENKAKNLAVHPGFFLLVKNQKLLMKNEWSIYELS